MTLPVLVTLAGAVVGNILGYTVFKDVCAAMYYGSYSLPTYVTIWNAEAFLLTTVVPVVIMVLINYAVLRYRLQLSPLKFLRRVFPEKTEACHISESEDRNLFQVPSACDLPEYKQLYCTVYWSCFCQSFVIFRNASAICTGSLSA